MRVYRLLAIVMILLNKSKVSAGELAEEFEVSPRTIYRDIESICQAGIPVVSHQGSDGGFSLMDNYKLDNNLFTAGEMFSILAALEGLNSTINDSSLKYTTEKIKNLFSENKDKSRQQLVMDLNPWGENEEIKEKLELIKGAIKNKRLLKVSYINAKQETSSRNIEPITLVLRGTVWYLYAFCLMRDDYRIFRLSRILDINVKEETYDGLHQDFQEFEENNNWQQPENKITLELLFVPGSLRYIQDYFSRGQIEAREDGSYLVKVEFPEDDWVYGFILRFGDRAEVLNPPHVREIIKMRAKNIYDKY